MKVQMLPSSSIIIVLTDGKLEVYPYELSVQEVTVPRPQLVDGDHLMAFG